MKTTRLGISLREVTPPVRRVLDAPADSTLPELHQLLQAAMGWADVHLHEFDTRAGHRQADDDRCGDAGGGARYQPADPDLDGFVGSGLSGADADMLDEGVRDEAWYRLRDLGARWVYHYDFGDGWAHDVEVLGAGADRPGCPYGEGACPPEDCGGPYGYVQLQSVLADPSHADHSSMRRWLGGEVLPDFDQASTDRLVARTAGLVPESVRLLLDAVGAGARLTPAGRLPRVLVRSLQEHRPGWALIDRPAHDEDDLVPLTALHDVLRSVGLLRPRQGVLRAIKSASDDLEVLRRLRQWFGPEDGFHTRLVTDTLAVLLVEGPQRRDELPTRLLTLLGAGWAHRDGTPITVDDVGGELAGLAMPLEGLDQITVDGPRWRAGPSAATILPRVATLAATYSPDPAVAQPHYARPGL